MYRLSFWILLFVIFSVIFIIGLVFLGNPFPPYELISYQDLLDLLTPLVLIPIYWLLFKFASNKPSTLAEEIIFLVLASLWVMGQGMHLAANSISNLIESMASSGQVDVTGSDIFNLTYFYDEQLGHILWHIGMLGLAGLLIYKEWLQPAGYLSVWSVTILSGVIYGFTLFAITNEGQTVWLGSPFSILVILFTLVWGRRKLSKQPILAFLFIACLVAALLYAGWGIYWGDFPGFFEVGII